jgi:uncharacterized protein
MEISSNHRITDIAQLRAIFGEPHPVACRKLLDALDDKAMDFIGRSPFLVLGTADTEGNQDVSPKGGEPGFVQIADHRTLLVPDRKGNKLFFGLQNILSNPRVGLIFMVPGTDETLRVNGTAELSADPALLARLSSRGASAQLAIRVAVRECFFHCAKAFIRSQLWKPESWPQQIRFSWGEYLAAKAAMGSEAAEKIDRAVESDYKENL